MLHDRMRVCLVSEDLSLPADEGLKKFAYSILPAISRHLEVMTISTDPEGPLPNGIEHISANRFLISLKLRRAIAHYDPQAIIYLARASATGNSFIRCRILRSYARNAAVIMISLQPEKIKSWISPFIRWMQPDCLLAQSNSAVKKARSLGCNVQLIPSGVDSWSFHPVDQRTRERLRQTHGFAPSKPVVIHVGHLNKPRNVVLLNRIHKETSYETVAISSTSTECDDIVLEELVRGGTRVIRSHIENIAEFYQLADCYLFPVHVQTAAIGMPLSVLEAMACGVQAVSTPFGSLPVWLSGCTGIRFASSDDELVAGVIDVMRGRTHSSTANVRRCVEQFSWDSIAETIVGVANVAVSEKTGESAQPRPVSTRESRHKAPRP